MQPSLPNQADSPQKPLPAPLKNRSGRFALNFSWLLQLRWVAVIGQLVTILFVIFVLNVQVMVLPLAVVLAVTASSNLVLAIWYRSWKPTSTTVQQQAGQTAASPFREPAVDDNWSGNMVLGLVMTLDMLSLTTLLYSTGGLNNPFNFFFFVNLSLSALVVGRSWAWALNGLTIACFALLIYDHIPIPELDAAFAISRSGFESDSAVNPSMVSDPGTMLNGSMQRVRETRSPSVPQLGALVAFATCSSVIVYFMTRLTDELRLQERNLRLAESRQAHSEKLEALGTLAAGAAHELATPLSTIAIVAREVEHQLDKLDVDDEIAEDVRLIRGELDRCRKILDQMSADAGHATGESPKLITVGELVDEVLIGLSVLTGRPNVETVEIHFRPNVAKEMLLVPPNILAQAIRGIVKNGVDATVQKHEQKILPSAVQLHVERDESEKHLRIRIHDQGVGMDENTQRRMSDPFFTTKPVGQGMGLGVFLAISVIERLDGRIHFDSQPDVGTTAEILLPITNP